MKLLLDTHILIWMLADDPKLPQKARELILDETNELYISTVSIWEVVVKHALHPHKMPYSGKILYDICLQAGLKTLAINTEHILAIEGLRREKSAPPHKDPFDRVLIAQSKTEGLILITHDSLLQAYGEPCVLTV